MIFRLPAPGQLDTHCFFFERMYLVIANVQKPPQVFDYDWDGNPNVDSHAAECDSTWVRMSKTALD
jgi:hypothetical protein